MAIVEGNPTPFGEKIASSIIRAKKGSPNGTLRLAIPKAESRLPVTIGVAKPSEPVMKYTAEDIWKFQLKNNFPNDTLKEVVKFLNQTNWGTVEPGVKEKLKGKWNSCENFFAKTEVEIFNEKTRNMEKKVLVHVKELSDFLHFIIEQRNLVYSETEALINIDKGGNLLKFTLTLSQLEEIVGEPLTTGVNKPFIVAMLVDGTEANSTLEMIMDKMNIWDCACKYCNDLKVSANLCGLMAGWPKFPCPYYTLGKMRTIESLFQHYEDYEQH